MEIDLRTLRLEDLIARRQLLVNSVLLRQNPHNVTEWLKRIELFEKQKDEDAKAGEDPGVMIQKIGLTYGEAVTTVDPQKATGKPHQLWINFAKFYEANDVCVYV